MRFVIISFFIGLFFTTSSFSSLHEYYVSIATVTYKQESKVLEITIKFTAHDVEKCLLKKGNLKLGTAKELENADEILANYIKSKFSIWANGGKLNLDYVGKEVEDDESLYIHLVCKTPRILKTVKFENLLLYESFPSQENIVNFNSNKNKKALSFNRNKSVHEFIF